MILKSALIGKHIEASLSPLCHTDIYHLLQDRIITPFSGIDYSLIECPSKEMFTSTLENAYGQGITAFNITSPYKNIAAELSTNIIGDASVTRAVNTLSITSTSITALSTDGSGFLSSLLREYPAFNLENYDLICIGAGATARSILCSLCTRWMPRSLTIINRTRSHGDELADFCISTAPGPTVASISMNDKLPASLSSTYRLFLQVSSVSGMSSIPESIRSLQFDETDIVCDVHYHTLQTPIMDLASVTDRKYNGLGMLIEQAAMSQYYWLTGNVLPSSPLTDDEYFQLKHKYSLRYS